MPKPDAILIAGPTASGKSQLAMDVAQAYEGEIINTDSMQIYNVLRVLTARPSSTDEATVSHHLYGCIAPTESFSVAKWLTQARSIAANIRQRGRIPVFVGGTGLYFKALESGLAEVPDIAPEIRTEIRAVLDEQGSEKLHERLARLDPAAAARLRSSDGQRIARALEVVEATGISLSDFQDRAQSEALLTGLDTVKILLTPPRPKLHEKINSRTSEMLEQGAIDEVRALLALDLPLPATAMKAIGVGPIADHLSGDVTLGEATEKIRAATRQYAKRQSTWFRGQHGDDWRHVSTAEEALGQLSG